MKNIDNMSADELRAELRAMVLRAEHLQHYANANAQAADRSSNPADVAWSRGVATGYANASGYMLPKEPEPDDEVYIPDSLDEAENDEEAKAWFEHQQMMAEDLHDRMKEDGA